MSECVATLTLHMQLKFLVHTATAHLQTSVDSVSAREDMVVASYECCRLGHEIPVAEYKRSIDSGNYF